MTPKHELARSSRPAKRSSFRRIVPILAAVVLISAGGWVVLRGTSEAADDPMAGHDMSKMGASAAAIEAADQVVPVDLGEFFVKPDPANISAGTIAFKVTNSGEAEHEFMLADLDVLSEKDVESLSSNEVHAKVVASLHGLTSGADQVITADLDPGRYLLFCNLSGHFGQGQSTVIEVV